jgi:serine protease Do
MTKPGTSVPIEFLRNGAMQTVQATIGTMPRSGAPVLAGGGQGAGPSAADALGLTVKNIDSTTRTQMGLPAGAGVSIDSVTGPIAAQAGLQPGDIVLMVNQKKVGSAAAFHAAIAGVRGGDTVLLLVRRGDVSNFVALTLPADGDR